MNFFLLSVSNHVRTQLVFLVIVVLSFSYYYVLDYKGYVAAPTNYISR